MRLRTLQVGAGALLVGLLAAACGGDGTPATSPPKVASAPVRSAAAGAACPASAGLADGTKDHGSAKAGGVSISIEAGDSFFAPTCLTEVPSGKVMIAVKNSGSALHNFSIPDQGVDVDVASGKTATFEVNVSSGATGFFCKYHRTSGMAGALLEGPG